MKLFKTIAIVGIGLAGLILSACETTPEVRWATSQGLYNETVDAIADYRVACVAGIAVEDGGYLNAGPDHPRCFIDDDTMRQIAPIRAGADAVLREMDVAATAGNDLDYGRLLVRFNGYVSELVMLKLEAARAGDPVDDG